MKLTILNKLEKKLHASRGREVPDLKPPPGGWEAINAKLTANPVGERAPVDQPAMASWIKWWGGGIGVLLLVVAAAFMPPSVKAPAKQAEDVVTQQALAVVKTEVTDVEGTIKTPEAKERQQKEEKVIRNSAVTDPPESAQSDVLIKPADKTTFAEQREENLVGQKITAAVEQEEQAEPVSNNRSLGKATTSKGVATNMDVPETAPILPQDELDEVALIDVDTSQFQTTAPEAKPEIFADISREVYLPIELPSPLFGLKLPAAQWPLKSMSVIPGKLGLFKLRRLKARPEWQLHGSISGFVGEDYDGTVAYSVAPPGGAGPSFIRPSGGLIHVAPDAIRENSNRLEQIYLKVGINRQTSSGFLFRSSIGLFRSKSFQIGPEGMLMADQVEVKTAKNETIVPVELGLQYTFLRRRRIKPYAGVHLIGYLNYLGVDESYFTEGATAEEGLVSRFSSQEFIALAPDLAVTLGLQYQISRRISAGAFLWGNIGGNFFVQAPLGMEIRYSLK